MKSPLKRLLPAAVLIALVVLGTRFLAGRRAVTPAAPAPAAPAPAAFARVRLPVHGLGRMAGAQRCHEAGKAP